MALVSPYPKANVEKRLFAATIDGLLFMTAWFLYRNLNSLVPLAGGAVYLLMRDAVGGQSIGKIMLGLTVIRVETGRPCSAMDSVRRNVMLLVPGANLVAVFLEAVTILRDSQGQRLGDRLAQTQVVEGLGAKDLAAAAYDWWRAFLARLEKEPRRRRRAEEMDRDPTQTPRAESSGDAGPPRVILLPWRSSDAIEKHCRDYVCRPALGRDDHRRRGTGCPRSAGSQQGPPRRACLSDRCGPRPGCRHAGDHRGVRWTSRRREGASLESSFRSAGYRCGSPVAIRHVGRPSPVRHHGVGHLDSAQPSDGSTPHAAGNQSGGAGGERRWPRRVRGGRDATPAGEGGNQTSHRFD